MKIKEIINYLENLAPKEYSLDWDNCGIQVGSLEKEIKNISIALTPTIEIIEKAIENKSDFLITHHPMIFKSLKSINTDSPIGKMIELSLKNNLTVYTMHTNFDSVETGLNYEIAKDLNLNNIELLSISGQYNYYKIVIFVLSENTNKIIDIVSKTNQNFYNSKKENILVFNYSDKDRIEITSTKKEYKHIIKNLKENIDNDFLYDVYKIEDKEYKYGIGTIGVLSKPKKLEEIIKEIKLNLNLKNLTYVGEPSKNIERIAICTGSGSSFINLAKQKGADLYITGDIKYHTAIDANEINLAMIDAGHYGTEIICVKFISNYIKKEYNNIDVFDIIENDPFFYA
ncbi:MAG: Nif3-like dinuclear metal center hexameric protein [Cyanobacteriota bacterium]